MFLFVIFQWLANAPLNVIVLTNQAKVGLSWTIVLKPRAVVLMNWLIELFLKLTYPPYPNVEFLWHAQLRELFRDDIILFEKLTSQKAFCFVHTIVTCLLILDTLILKSNAIEYFNKDMFLQMKRIRVIDLSYNRIKTYTSSKDFETKHYKCRF
jgi:hypothetical protein